MHTSDHGAIDNCYCCVDHFREIVPLPICLHPAQAHAKRVAAENKRSRRYQLGGGFGGGRSRAARPKMGNARGKVIKAFVADSDSEDEDSEEVS